MRSPITGARPLGTVFLLVTVCCLLLTAAVAQKGVNWQRVTLKKVSLSVLMPGTPKIEEGELTSDEKTGAKVLAQTASLQNEDRYYYGATVIRYNDSALQNIRLVNTDKGDKQPTRIIADALMEDIPLTKGIKSSKTTIRSGGLSGTETTFTGKEKGKRIMMKVRALTDKHSVVLIFGGQIGTNIDPAAMNRFLDSATLGPLSPEFLEPAAPAPPKAVDPDPDPASAPTPAEPEKP